MNSYGSVSLVSQSIHRVLHYLNWFSNEVEDDDNDVNDSDAKHTSDAELCDSMTKNESCNN
jgi:hypothetical protein